MKSERPHLNLWRPRPICKFGPGRPKKVSCGLRAIKSLAPHPTQNPVFARIWGILNVSSHICVQITAACMRIKKTADCAYPHIRVRISAWAKVCGNSKVYIIFAVFVPEEIFHYFFFQQELLNSVYVQK